MSSRVATGPHKAGGGSGRLFSVHRPWAGSLGALAVRSPQDLMSVVDGAHPKTYFPESLEISSKKRQMSFCSWTNLTFASDSADSSMAFTGGRQRSGSARPLCRQASQLEQGKAGSRLVEAVIPSVADIHDSNHHRL